MAHRPTNSDHEPGVAAGGGPAVRRAPYSDNPTVGARGLRTQQRVLDAALQVFGEVGYERTTIDRIAQLAGCSRVSFYQYFAGKEDVFRHLAGQVARQLRASAEALEPVSPDAAGWSALRAWVARYADIHARYEPVFRAFGAAAGSDAQLAGGSVRAGARNVAVFQSKLAATTLPPRHLDAVVGLLHGGVTRTLEIASMLRAARPEDYARDRVDDALTDVVHRALFGLLPDVNVHGDGHGPPPPLRISSAVTDAFRQATELEHEATQPGRRALASLLEVADDVVVKRGYHGTRVDDVVAAAGVSHGAFYRYFANKDELVRVITVRAFGAISSALAEVPAAGADRTALRRWLRRYQAAHAAQGDVIRVWVEAGLADDALRADRAALFDWGRRRARGLLAERGFGDVDVDAVVLLGIVEAFGARPAEPVELDAALHAVQRGLLGQDR